MAGKGDQTEPHGQDEFNGLANAVSYSSQLVAAYRGLETEEEDALYRDPLAIKLAGEAAMADARTKSSKWEHGSSSASSKRRRTYQYSVMACRTKFFDDLIADFMHGLSGPKQVVLMGAGMDTRAWRIDVPEGVAWFEIDMPDVLQAKQRYLSHLGAEWGDPKTPAPLPPAPPAGGPTNQEYRYPLQARSWSCFPADLQADSWPDLLKRHGFKPALPTMWVPEGLLMYLEPTAVDKLLAGMAGLSAPGSRMAALAFNQAVLERPELLVEDWGSTPALAKVTATFKSGMPDDPGPWLKQRGWQAQQVLTCAAIARRVTGPGSQYGFDMDESGLKGRRRFFITAEPVGA